MRGAALALVASLAGCLSAPDSGVDTSPYSVRFLGQPFADNGIDRVWIPAHGMPPGRLGNGAFTVEMWIKLEAGSVPDAPCDASEWWRNTIVLDREFYVTPSDGNIGISVWQDGTGSGVVAGFEVNGATDPTQVNLCGDQPIADDAWHHVALVREFNDRVSIYVDGVLDETAAGPTGDGSVATDVVTDQPGDLSMVLGGDKFGFDPAIRNFAGWIDDLRLSVLPVYRDPFDPPAGPLEVDDGTVALYRFDEGEGSTSINSADPDVGDAELRQGGDPQGPAWSTDTPY